MPSPVSTRLPERATPASGLAWTVHPARRSLPKLVAAVAATLAAGVLAAMIAESAAVGLLSVALLVLSLRRFYFPTRTIVAEDGVAVRCLGLETRRSWDRLNRFRYDEHGAFLSTRARPSALDVLTGLHLTWGGDREQAVAFIERRLPSPHGALSSR
ncbi:MAG: hypothetical protein WBC44_16710 [Planctomycetaceae bacterium]